ncbi:MAG TPA: hypothetical protein VFQ85_13485 [Mycobacteriales bacterium]|nr:hypothetical protein [Mycobacteriales bacterium]
MGVVYVSAAVVAVCGVVRWWLYLRLCRHVFDQTKDPQAVARVARSVRR